MPALERAARLALERAPTGPRNSPAPRPGARLTAGSVGGTAGRRAVASWVAPPVAVQLSRMLACQRASLTLRVCGGLSGGCERA